MVLKTEYSGLHALLLILMIVTDRKNQKEATPILANTLLVSQDQIFSVPSCIVRMHFSVLQAE
jgi:hypothetical protein